MADTADPRFSLLTGHGTVLLYIGQHPSAKITEIATAAELSERRVIRIIGELRHAGYLEARRVGRGTHYSLNLERAMPHPVANGRPVFDLLARMLGLYAC